MGVLEEVKRMGEEGQSEQEIVSSLRERGLSNSEIQNVLSQARIKAAVFSEESPPALTQQQSEEKLPSIMNSRPQIIEGEERGPESAEQSDIFPSSQSPVPNVPSPSQGASPEEEQGYYQSPMSYPQQSYPQQQYQSQSSQSSQSLSSDTISEIAEEILAEKLYPLRNELEKVISLKTSIESRIAYLEERFKRIESMMDKLQVLLMQRVGEYVNDIGDIKKEITETQKSFKSLITHHKK